jgi:hypothetical protein
MFYNMVRGELFYPRHDAREEWHAVGALVLPDFIVLRERIEKHKGLTVRNILASKSCCGNRPH